MTRLGTLLATLGVASLLFTPGCNTAVHGSSCSVEQLPDGDAVVTCTDGTTALLEAGSDGLSCSIEELGDGSKLLSCEDGTEAWIHDGIDGLAGLDAESASGCMVWDNADGTYTLGCGEPGTDEYSEVIISDGADGLDGADGQDGQDGKDGQDGQDAVLNPTAPGADPVLESDLTEEDEERIDQLRDSIDQGLSLGEVKYLEKVSLDLKQMGIVDDYETMVTDDFSGASLTPQACPFVQHYDNGFLPSGFACDYLADLAKVEVYAELAELMDDQPLPDEIATGQFAEEAEFWYEQGAISGIEKQRILVRTDLSTQLVCNVNPTPYEASYDKGLVIGMQSMVNAFNAWLSTNGHVADYPVMSQPIEVCNVNESLLDPAHQAALQNVPITQAEHPLCEDYEPPTSQHALEYAQAAIDYSSGITDGVHNEFELAAVRIFKVVPCNVGDPLVVDLDGDGLELLPIHRGVNFDFYATDRPQAVAWVAPDDALLVRDVNENGRIDDGSELFGNVDRQHADGFAHLELLDDNRDGVVDASDAAWTSLQLWQDRDSDGVSTPDELLPLATVGLQAIPLAASEVSLRSEGTRIPLAIDAVGSEGPVMIGDALFQTAPHASPSLAR